MRGCPKRPNADRLASELRITEGLSERRAIRGAAVRGPVILDAMGRLWWIVLASVGCGRIAFDVPGGEDRFADAGGGTTGDARDDATTCALGPWQEPVRVIGVETLFDEAAPTVRFDGLEMVFVRNMATDNQLYSVRRSSTTEAFGSATALTALNTATHDDGPALSADGLTLYYKSELTGIRLWSATRATLDAEFGAPAELAGGPFGEQGDPSIADSGLELFEGDSDGDLFVSTRPSTIDTFGPPQLLPAPLASANWQEGPFITADGTTLYYVEFVNSLFEIMVATRSAPGAAFEATQSLPELAGGEQEWDPELSRDGRTMYFVRYDSGESNIYVMTRDCL